MQGPNISTAVRIGCSGWAYKHWRGLFYPEGLPQRLWFERYSQEFDTVEINASFYHLPKPETFPKWREQAPAGFCYAVKANRFITQAKKLLDCEEPLERMMSATRNLGDRLGPMLYQLPPSLKIDVERLERFLKLLPNDISNVFEFRHPSWYEEAVLALLDAYGCGFVAHDMRGLVSPRWASGTTAYVRFHGHGGKYWGRYPDEVLNGWADWACDQLNQGRTAWCYFNNDIHGHAIEDARTLKRMVQEKSA
ncbi:MAG: DUF72 domain-containing protein [Pseudomonadota bacterium]